MKAWLAPPKTLTAPTGEIVPPLQEYIEKVHRLSYPTHWELAKDYVKGRFLDEETNCNHIYCAELVAETYMHLGILATDHPPWPQMLGVPPPPHVSGICSRRLPS